MISDRTAEITYRIPADRWEAALDSLRGLNGLTTKVVTEHTEAVEVTAQVIDLDRESIPSSRLGRGTIRHRLTTTARLVWDAEHETKGVSLEHRERGRWMHLEGETEMSRIERNRRVRVVDDVSNLNGRHALLAVGSGILRVHKN